MRKSFLYILTILCLTYTYVSCSKGDSSDTTDPCAGVTVSVTGTVVSTPTGENKGSIEANATGGSGFTFSLNNGAFQQSGTFNNLAAGTYTVTAKNSNGCKGSQQFTVTATSACAGTNITITSSTSNAVPCSGNTGSITITATGSTGFTYSLNNGAFQSANTFSNLNAGNYNVTVKDAVGCTQTASVAVSDAPAGPLFSAVGSIIRANCISCHSGSRQEGGMNWADPCNILSHKARIKVRAVDQAGTSNQMPQPPNPPLSSADRQKIIDWINAGGSYTN